jgi:hypothetical protein
MSADQFILLCPPCSDVLKPCEGTETLQEISSLLPKECRQYQYSHYTTFKRNSKHILFGTQPHDSPRQYFSNCGLQWFARWSAAVSGENKSTAKIVSDIE